jgi:hypothetical protein
MVEVVVVGGREPIRGGERGRARMQGRPNAWAERDGGSTLGGGF